MPLIEERLRRLMLQCLGGDASSYHSLINKLATHLRSFFRKRLAGLPDACERTSANASLVYLGESGKTMRPRQGSVTSAFGGAPQSRASYPSSYCAEQGESVSTLRWSTALAQLTD